jgi:hypothetical protein
MQTLPLDANLASGGGSPKMLFQCFYYNLAQHYFETLRTTQDAGNIEQSTAAIIALCCPDKDKREQLWKRYTLIMEGKDPDVMKVGESQVVTASVLVIGDLTSYLNEVLEFTEKSTAAYL